MHRISLSFHVKVLGFITLHKYIAAYIFHSSTEYACLSIMYE
jgi:hypothetical protein